jgi:hypothetical protein
MERTLTIWGLGEIAHAAFEHDRLKSKSIRADLVA